jgi:hypothetical protein
MNAAREADDPHLIALGAWALSGSYRRAGQQVEATRLCLAAADELEKRIDSSDLQKTLLADYGMLHLAAAISAAQSDEDGRVWALHRVAEDAARALESHYDAWTAFGRGNVDNTRMSHVQTSSDIRAADFEHRHSEVAEMTYRCRETCREVEVSDNLP